jgi:hypothetical protein
MTISNCQEIPDFRQIQRVTCKSSKIQDVLVILLVFQHEEEQCWLTLRLPAKKSSRCWHQKLPSIASKAHDCHRIILVVAWSSRLRDPLGISG